jgi:hypothetical protein
MCFSATASFTAAAVAGSIGAVTLWKAAKLDDRAILPIAAFPALFALQQGIEGLLWLDLARPAASACRPFLTHGFTGYAEVFWPTFAPLAAWLIEPVRWRRHVISVCFAVGLAVSAYLLWKMLGNPYTASATGHMVYSNGATYPKGIEIPYVFATTISLLLSSHRLIQLLAAVILGGFAVAWWSYHQSYISVWCFFAAISSIIVYLFVDRAARSGQVSR